MFVKTTKSRNGRVYLAIVHNYREGNKTKSRTVRSLGYLDELEKYYDNPLAHFKAMCEKQNAETKTGCIEQAITFSPMEKIDPKVESRRNIGCTIPLAHYNSLGIASVLRSRTKGQHLNFDINSVMRQLVMDRLLSYNPKFSVLHEGGPYFFKSAFSTDNIYQAFDYFASSKEAIISTMNRNIIKKSGRDATTAYFNVMNCFYKIGRTDKLNVQDRERECCLSQIVQVSLLFDQKCIPLDYCLTPSKALNCQSILHTLKNMKSILGLEKAVVVSDQGPDCSDDIVDCILDGNGFIFMQSLYAKKVEGLRNWVCSDEGYKSNNNDTYSMKSLLGSRILLTEDRGDRKSDVRAEIKIVAFRPIKNITQTIDDRSLAIEKINDPNSRANDYLVSLNAGTCIGKSQGSKKCDEYCRAKETEDSLEEDDFIRSLGCEECHCLITSETHLPDTEIVDTYLRFLELMENFKLVDSDVPANAAYVTTKKHLEAHILIDIIAFTILRLIEKDTDNKYPPSIILRELSAMSGTHLQDNLWVFDHRTSLSDELASTVGIDLSRKYMRLEEIKKIFSDIS